MSNEVLLSATIKITEKKKKTRAKFFKEVEVGDELELVYSLSGGYHYAPTVDIYYKGEMVLRVYPSQLSNNLGNFEWEQVS